MPEYIDREELIRRIDMVTDTVGFPGNIAIKELIYNVPAADVAPVVHERCEFCKDRKTFIGAMVIGGNDGRFHKINYCPNCGAKLDLEKCNGGKTK